MWWHPAEAQAQLSGTRVCACPLQWDRQPLPPVCRRSTTVWTYRVPSPLCRAGVRLRGGVHRRPCSDARSSHLLRRRVELSALLPCAVQVWSTPLVWPPGCGGSHRGGAVRSVEATLKLVAVGPSTYFRDNWNVLDCTATAISWFSQFLMATQLNVTVFRVVKVVRLFPLFEGVQVRGPAPCLCSPPPPRVLAPPNRLLPNRPSFPPSPVAFASFSTCWPSCCSCTSSSPRSVSM